MATTYLQLVNNVLIRLREQEVSSVGDTVYSSLIGVLVNDATEYPSNQETLETLEHPQSRS